MERVLNQDHGDDLRHLKTPSDPDPAPAPDEDLPEYPARLPQSLWICFLAVLAIEAVVLGLLYVPIPPNPDQELYDYMAWTALEGGALYKASADMNMPGEAFLHMASMKMFGNHYWSYRLIDYLLVLGFAGAVGLMSRRYFGKTFSGLFFGLYPFIYTTSGAWMAGQRDLLATHAIVIAAFAHLRRIEGGRPSWMIVTATATAAATLLKPTYLIFGPILLMSSWLFIRRGWKKEATDAAVLAMIGAVALGSVFFLGWATDSLKAWYEITVLYSTQNYIGGVGNLSILKSIILGVSVSWQWYTVMALSSLFCMFFQRHKLPLVVVFSAFATVIVSTFVQRKGFGYHFGGLLSVMTLMIAYYLTEIIHGTRRIPDARLRCAVLSFPVILVLSGLMSKGRREFGDQVGSYLDRSRFGEMMKTRLFDDVLAASDYLRASTQPGDQVWTYSNHAMINSLAERAMPSRFSCYALLRFPKASPLGDRWREEVETVFRERAPAMVVLERLDNSEPETYFCMAEVRPHEPVSALKEALDRSYVRDRRIGRFVFFRRSAGISPVADGPKTSATELRK